MSARDREMVDAIAAIEDVDEDAPSYRIAPPRPVITIRAAGADPVAVAEQIRRVMCGARLP